MELPPLLRQGVDAALVGISLSDLGRAAGTLSARYRAEIRDGRFHLSDDLAARAYLATRLPATYAAIRAAMVAISDLRSDFAPADMLDLGAGPGSAFWAAMDCWPGLSHALLVEGSASIRAWGEKLSLSAPVEAEWRSGDVSGSLADLPSRDLVTLAYVLDELDEAARGPLIARLWELTRDTLLVVEPGTPAGWERILAARERLIAAGATLLAPCTHAAACPLVRPDWCHFSRRVARSRLHRQAKGAEVPWEDEKFIYLAASRFPGDRPAARVIAPPRLGSGQVRLKLCLSDGQAQESLFTKRSGADFKQARRAEWGDAL
ncbi:small ribosomal subunit Rsm22 family protein [Microvirga puerhi]|uniref:Methyltransferase type 11 n=1 Tax=Microvirga puerhi TaxID=2876078 RepID=A0ABS7VJE3_9HYPH|nr:small ribosomal subunit Rsm22 family protein [Microvirga puerhi]MBZ6075636.1 methyltransferase type 11 [Microvirga puerhi]